MFKITFSSDETSDDDEIAVVPTISNQKGNILIDFSSDSNYSDHEAEAVIQKNKTSISPKQKTRFTPNTTPKRGISVRRNAQKRKKLEENKSPENKDDKANVENDKENKEEKIIVNNDENQSNGSETSDDNVESGSNNSNILDDIQKESQENQTETKAANDHFYEIYFINRVSRINPLAPSQFQFKIGTNVLYYLKTTALITDRIFISSDADVNPKENKFDYEMKVSKNKTHFVLRKKDSDEPILILDFSDDYDGDEYGPRKITMFWPAENKTYVSRVPVKNKKGQWKLNFNGKYVVKSQKNAIMLDENSKPVILVRKIEKDVLEIEVIKDINPIELCAFGVASFVCPI